MSFTGWLWQAASVLSAVVCWVLVLLLICALVLVILACLKYLRTPKK